MRWHVTAAELLQRPRSNRQDGDGVYWLGHATYFGRAPDRSLLGRDDLGIAYDWEEPAEPSADGCPAAWARSPFCDSVYPYHRRRTDAGDRVDHPSFSSAPWQVQQAAEYLEAEQERWREYRAEIDHRRWQLANDRKK